MSEIKCLLKSVPLCPCDICKSDDTDDCDICDAYKRYSNKYDGIVDLLDITDNEKILLKKPFYDLPQHSF